MPEQTPPSPYQIVPGVTCPSCHQPGVEVDFSLINWYHPACGSFAWANQNDLAFSIECMAEDLGISVPFIVVQRAALMPPPNEEA